VTHPLTIRPFSVRRIISGLITVAVTVAVVVAGPLLVPPAAQAAAGCSSTPFRSSPAHHRWYRIPAVVATNSGALVAFAESRDTSDTTDMGNFDIATARSVNHGCSWSAPTVIASDAANRVSNPAPILDVTTGRLLLFSVVTVRPGSGGSGKGLYLQTSSDDGRTFSPLLSHPVRPAGAYRGGLTGPGHGIQLTVSHPGRLILPMGYKTAAGLYGAYGIYSDDHGATWQTGYDQQDTSGNADFMEGTVAELPSGKLFISYRLKHDGAKPGTARQYAVSTDGGASLAGRFSALPLKIVSVEGSALALTGKSSGQLLFSAPADQTPTLRRDMTIFVSSTGGTSWTRKYQIELESAPAAYSDLVQLGPNSIGVLYETGVATWKERIAFESIAITALTHPTLAGSSLGFDRSKHPTKTSVPAKVMVRVTVKGISSPPGRVTLRYAGHGRTRSVSVDLTYSNRGVRQIVLPRLPRGDYRLSLAYSGTTRIKPLTKPAGTLHVV
jgi:sialidase-1